MINEVLHMLFNLVKNLKFWLLFILSVILTAATSVNQLSIEGFKMIPASIGVLLGGLLATIAIIFAIMQERDLKLLYQKYGDKFFNAINRLKYHVILILFSLVATLFAFFINAPPFLVSILKLCSISVMQLFYFIQIFFTLLTVFVSLEVINILFLIFEIKFTLISKDDMKKG